MREVYVLGIGQTMFGKMPNYTAVDLGAMAVKSALDDAGISPRMIEAAYAAKVNDPIQTSQDVMRRIGVANIPQVNVENACSSGLTAINLLWKDIALGVCDIGVAVGCESMTTLRGKLLTGSQTDLNILMGFSMPGSAALTARRLMYTRGATEEDLAYPSYKNHKNALLNPYAHYRKQLSMEDIMNSRMISDPITLMECCPQTDGAAAAILCTKEIAKRYTTNLIQIASSVICSSNFERSDTDITNRVLIRKLSSMAYENAGIGPEDLDLVELHDAFSVEELYTYELLGLCPDGEGIAFARSGAAEIGGKIPVNPSGGLLSLGHPLGASGVRVICEVTSHLRGTAGDRQVKDAKVGMAEMVGGTVTGLATPSSGSICILKK